MEVAKSQTRLSNFCFSPNRLTGGKVLGHLEHCTSLRCPRGPLVSKFGVQPVSLSSRSDPETKAPRPRDSGSWGTCGLGLKLQRHLQRNQSPLHLLERAQRVHRHRPQTAPATPPPRPPPPMSCASPRNLRTPAPPSDAI